MAPGPHNRLPMNPDKPFRTLLLTLGAVLTLPLLAAAPAPAARPPVDEEVIALPEFAVGASAKDNTWAAASSLTRI